MGKGVTSLEPHVVSHGAVREGEVEGHGLAVGLGPGQAELALEPGVGGVGAGLGQITVGLGKKEELKMCQFELIS